MTTPYEALAPDMNAQVDTHLGDSVSVHLRGAPLTDPPITIVGFVNANPVATIGGTDPIRIRWSLSVTEQVLPGGPHAILKLTAAMLDGWYKPAAGTIERDGDGWICDLQKTV